MRIGLLLLSALAVCSSIAAADPHNVVLIVVDDAGPELFGVYDQYFASIGQPGGHAAATPAIDSMLAARGVTFTRAWANPVCSPTRATLLTGRYSRRTGIGDVTAVRPVASRSGLSYSEVLLPEVLRMAEPPMQSIALGKWHLADRAQLDADPRHPLGSPAGRWFDAWSGTYFVSGAPEGFDPEVHGYSVWKKSYASDVSATPTACAPATPPCQALIATPPMTNYATANTTEDAIVCLQQATGPLFLYVAYNAIHKPLHDVPSGLPLPGCAEYSPTTLPCANNSLLPSGPARARCMLEALDAQIGRLLCEVDFETTTVILIGDNGTLREGAHPPYLPSHAKDSLYEGGVRVPLIVRSPVVPTVRHGAKSHALVNSTDVFATICDLVGVVAPPNVAEDSLSFVECLTGAGPGPRKHLYAEQFLPHFVPDPLSGGPPASYGAKHHSQAVSDGRFKLIRNSRRNANGPPLVTEKFFDFEQGGPPAAGSSTPTPDWFEQYDLLLAGTMSPEASGALDELRATLDGDFPYLTR